MIFFKIEKAIETQKSLQGRVRKSYIYMLTSYIDNDLYQ